MNQITIENELYPRWGKQSMKLSRVLGSVGVVSAAALALVACGKSSNNNAGAKDAIRKLLQLRQSKRAALYHMLKKLIHLLQVFLTMNYQLLLLTQM